MSPSVSRRPCCATACSAAHCARTAASRVEQLGVGEKIDLVGGKIDRGLDVGAQLRQRLIERAHARREFALERSQRGARGRFAAGVDEIGDRLGLRQVQLVVQVGALRELTRLRAARTELERRARSALDQQRAAVAVQFEHGLAGVGMRRREIQRQPFIERCAVGAQETRALRVARLAAAGRATPRRSRGACGPEMRTMPMPPRPGGLAVATMVSAATGMHPLPGAQA